MYACHLFLISSASVRSVPFLSFIEPILACSVPLVSLNFLEELSSLSHRLYSRGLNTCSVWALGHVDSGVAARGL